MNDVAKTPETPAVPALTHDTWSAGLDDMEVQFVLAYTSGKTARNAERAAIEAGYEKTTARVKSFGWVSKSSPTKPKVRAAIDFILNDKWARERMSADEVLA